MFVNISLLLTTIGLLFFLGLLRLFVPLVKENRRGKKVLHGVGGERGLKPHWLLGHLREVSLTMFHVFFILYDFFDILKLSGITFEELMQWCVAGSNRF